MLKLTRVDKKHVYPNLIITFADQRGKQYTAALGETGPFQHVHGIDFEAALQEWLDTPSGKPVGTILCEQVREMNRQHRLRASA